MSRVQDKINALRRAEGEIIDLLLAGPMSEAELNTCASNYGIAEYRDAFQDMVDAKKIVCHNGICALAISPDESKLKRLRKATDHYTEDVQRMIMVEVGKLAAAYALEYGLPPDRCMVVHRQRPDGGAEITMQPITRQDPVELIREIMYVADNAADDGYDAVHAIQIKCSKFLEEL